MKNIINWKIFIVLLSASMIAVLMVFPYTLAISPSLAQIFSPTVLIGVFVQSLLLYSIAIFLGLILAKRVGFGLPLLEGFFKNINTGIFLKNYFLFSVIAGVLGGILVVLLSFIFPELSITFLKIEMSVSTWKRFFASFYGGVGEEIFLRLFVMTLFVWLASRLIRTSDGKPKKIVVWVSIILSSVLFGLGHLGVTGDMTDITSEVVLRAVLLNGVVGVIFSWLYWKKGLESAIIAHFSADIVIHVITPLTAAIFI